MEKDAEQSACKVGEQCAACGKRLSQDEIGLTKKLVSRGTERFFCLDCLSRQLGVSTGVLQEKVRQFREMGCTLFQ